MHIPDGYLSPSTCATMYALATTGWYASLRQIKRRLAARTIPLISVFAAFSFVIMMFNLPLPGGTTGHAVGVAIAAIVLGPAGAILSISIAITIQALFFGDGGITTLGANCFNMAVVGALVAYGVYFLATRGNQVSGRRRFIAGAIAGYVAVNASALFTAIELGLQPLLFHTTSGAPLYAPYPLKIAVPAMMIGHLAIAGVAEAVITAGLVGYLQREHASLLAPVPASVSPVVNPSRRLWVTVGVLMLLTPLGVLAAGTAWGEWSTTELAQRGSVPAGLAELANIWTAPFPTYAPSFLHNQKLGYLLSAMFAVGLFLLASMIGRYVVDRRSRGGVTS